MARALANLSELDQKLYLNEAWRTESATGGDTLIAQYPGPTTGGLPIYAGRFNMEKRRRCLQELRQSAGNPSRTLVDWPGASGSGAP
jgi:hypothetical protein